MFTGEFPEIQRDNYTLGHPTSRHGDETTSRHENVGDDIPKSQVPPIPPMCPRCEIPIYQGFTHINMVDCIVAMKAFIAVCQDQIEKDRMESFVHPTRDELLQHMRTMAQQFEQLASYADTLSQYVRHVLRVTLLAYAQQPTTHSDAWRDARYQDPGESARSAAQRFSVTEINLDSPTVRELLQGNVPDAPQSLVQDQEDGERNADRTRSKPSRPKQVRPDVSPSKRLSSDDLRLQEGNML